MRLFLLGVLGISLVWACSPLEQGSDEPTPETLGRPARGFQLKTEARRIDAGSDIESCEVLELPGEPGQRIFVRRIEAAVEGSRHLFVSAVLPGSPMESRLHTGDRIACKDGLASLGNEQTNVLATGARYRDDRYPNNVGRIFEGGQKIILDHHYTNATERPVEVQTAINFHLVDESDVSIEAHSDIFSNLTIDIPAREARTFIGECRFDHDVMVSGIVRHTHEWGTDFSVWFVGGERDRRLAFSSASYSDTEHGFDPPLRLRAGEGFHFACSYFNPEQFSIRYGNGAKDENCALLVSWWPTRAGVIVPEQSCSLTSIDSDGVARQ